jgi:hypothetical protein
VQDVVMISGIIMAQPVSNWLEDTTIEMCSNFWLEKNPTAILVHLFGLSSDASLIGKDSPLPFHTDNQHIE